MKAREGKRKQISLGKEKSFPSLGKGMFFSFPREEIFPIAYIAHTLIFHFKALKSLKNMRVHVLHVKALLTKWPTAQLPFVEKEEEL